MKQLLWLLLLGACGDLPSVTVKIETTGTDKPATSTTDKVTKPLPVVLGLDITEGQAGTTVTISGKNFGEVPAAVTIAVGDQTIAPQLLQPEELKFKITPEVTAGQQAIVVTVDGQSASDHPTFLVHPVIESVNNSASGAVLSTGDLATIKGSGFGKVGKLGCGDASSINAGTPITWVSPDKWTRTEITYTTVGDASTPNGCNRSGYDFIFVVEVNGQIAKSGLLTY